MTTSEYNRAIYVYAKGATIQCLSSAELVPIQSELERAGWKHTATLDPARWIEALANARRDTAAADMILELILGPNTP